MPRVALLHNIISPHVVPLFQRLARVPDLDVKVYFLAETDVNRRWQTQIGDSFQYAVLPHRAIRVGRRDVHTFFINPGIISRLLRDGFDVIISAGWDSFAAMAGYMLCKRLRRPFILWSGSTINEPSWRRSVTLPLVKRIVHGSDAWIAYGSRAREYLVRLGADPGRIVVAYNTVDVESFSARADQLRPHRADLRARLGLADAPVALFVGQLIQRKGPQDLLIAHEQVRKRVPDAQLILVGYGPLEDQLRALVAERNIGGVVLTGHVTLRDLPVYYAVADVCVLPSHEEVWGLVLNEAAASGLPLVTTTVTGASADVVQSGRNGFSVPPGQPLALAEAIVESLQHASSMGAVSRQLISGMTYDQNIGAFRQAIRGACMAACAH